MDSTEIDPSLLKLNNAHIDDNEVLLRTFARNRISLSCLQDISTNWSTKNNENEAKVDECIRRSTHGKFLYYALCKSCDDFQRVIVESSKYHCSGCYTKLNLRETEFDNADVIMDFKQRMQNDAEAIRDIHDGRTYKNISDQYSSDEAIFVCSLMLNTDGVRVTQSSKDALWPVQLIVNALPPRLRYAVDNIIIAGLYYGKNNVDFQTFLLPLCKELDGLERGFAFDHLGTTYKVVPVVSHCVVDLVAKAKIQQIIQFNGNFACGYCKHPGVSVKNRKNTRSYVRYIYQNENAMLREHNETVELMLKPANTLPISGVKGLSAMVGFHHFNLIDGFGIDYMCGIFVYISI